ncbi:MAG: SCO family protein [Gemmatimonadota bacterium]|nr:SCO family protein [Gemmatimonadota bacterium]
MMEPRRPAAFPLAALGFIVVATIAWWALALWPLPEESPAWLARTREVCFGAVHNGLPTPAGWMALILEPLTLIGAVVIVWGRELREGLGTLRARPAGRGLLAGTGAVLLVGLSLAVLRVAGATPRGEAFDPSGGRATRRSAPAPALALVDQGGTRFAWERLDGRPAVVAFVFAHCATVCPTLVQDLLGARGASASPALVLVTLDPRRDTPPRLAAIAAEWRLSPGDFLLGGEVAEVEATAAGWGIPWQRDTLTGEIRHGTQLFVVSVGGRLEWVVAGGAAREAVRLASELGR